MVVCYGAGGCNGGCNGDKGGGGDRIRLIVVKVVVFPAESFYSRFHKDFVHPFSFCFWPIFCFKTTYKNVCRYVDYGILNLKK